MTVNVPILFGSALLLLSAGCASHATRLDQIQVGMTRFQVVTLLGEPDAASGRAGVEYLTYYLDDASRTRGQPYMLKVVDGRIESFGRYIRLADAYASPEAPGKTATMAAIVPHRMNTDSVTTLEQLRALRDEGVLTEDEFQRARNRLLGTGS